MEEEAERLKSMQKGEMQKLRAFKNLSSKPDPTFDQIKGAKHEIAEKFVRTIEVSSHDKENDPRRKISRKDLTEMVNRLSQRNKHKLSCQCELCKAGGTISHVKNPVNRVPRTAHRRSKSQNKSSFKGGYASVITKNKLKRSSSPKAVA